MLHRITLPLIFLGLFLAPHQRVEAQSIKFLTYKFESAYNGSDFNQAIIYGEQLLEKMREEQLQRNLDFVLLQQKLGSAYTAAGQVDQAYQHLRESTQAHARYFDTLNIEYARGLWSLGMVSAARDVTAARDLLARSGHIFYTTDASIHTIDDALIVMSLFMLGNDQPIEQRLSLMEKAYSFNETLFLLRPKETLQALHSYSNLLYTQNHQERFLTVTQDLLEKSLDYYPDTDPAGMLGIFMNKIMEINIVGDHDLALQYSQDLSELMLKTRGEHAVAYALSLCLVGYSMWRIGETYETTIGKFKQAIAIFDSYERNGQATPYLLDEVFDLPFLQSIPHMFLATIYEDINAEDAAYHRDQLQQYMGRSEKMGASDLLPSLLGATDISFDPQDEESAAILEQLRQSMQSPDNTISQSLLAILSSLEAMGSDDPAQALDIVKSIRSEAGFGYDQELNIIQDNLWQLEAQAYWHLGNYDESIRLYTLYQQLVKDKYGPSSLSYARVLARIAMVNYSKGISEKEAIRDHYTGSLLIYFQLLEREFFFLSDKQKASYLEEARAVLAQYCSFALDLNNSDPAINADCFRYITKLKGIILKSNQSFREQIQEVQDPELWQQFEQYIGLREDLALLYSVDADSVLIAGKEAELAVLESELKKYSNQSGNEVWYSEADDYLTRLQPDEALLEFYHFDYSNPAYLDSMSRAMSMVEIITGLRSKRYVAFLIQPGSPHPRLIDLFSEDAISARAQFIADSLVTGQVTKDYVFVKEMYESPFLYQTIWEKIDPHLDQGVTTIFLSPSGILHKVSFHAIQLPEGRRKYLTDRYRLITMMNSSPLLETRSEGKTVDKNVRFIGFGDIDYGGPEATESSSSRTDVFALGWPYLEGSRSELDDVQELLMQYQIPARVYSGSQATEDQFKSLDNKGRTIIHLSTHGYFFERAQFSLADVNQLLKQTETLIAAMEADSFGIVYEQMLADGTIKPSNSYSFSEEPMVRSGLIMANGNQRWLDPQYIPGEEDQILTAYEVANLNLDHTELVVLSACESGLGDIDDAEGVFGLQRAFKIAGADYLLVTLWEVDARTTTSFLLTFYELALQGLSWQEAFLETQQQFRNKSPYYWAGFQLIK